MNVILVAKPDTLLDEANSALEAALPEREFVRVPVDLTKRESAHDVAQALADTPCPQVCFLNAGYIVTGFFNQVPVEKHLANLECNVGHVLSMSHLLVNRTGCIVLTSSAAALMPGPFSSLYASTKAFLATFGSSLAAEVKSQGIDVNVFFPSPVASNFAKSLDHKIDLLDLFNKLAVPPEALPDAMFAAVGRCIYRDYGTVAVLFRLMSKLLDYNLLAWLTAATAHTMPDFKRHWRAAAADDAHNGAIG